MKEIIFFLEDDEVLAKNLKLMIEYSPTYQVIHFTNGKDAFTYAEHTKPSLVICDITMPGMNGYEFYEIFRNLGYYNVPFLFLTGSDSYHDIRKGMNLGADDYLVKPVPILDLLKAIKIRLRKSTQIENKYLEATEELKKEIVKRDEVIKNLNVHKPE
jgi:DNA-binding response OmpR family regulator